MDTPIPLADSVGSLVMNFAPTTTQCHEKSQSPADNNVLVLLLEQEQERVIHLTFDSEWFLERGKNKRKVEYYNDTIDNCSVLLVKQSTWQEATLQPGQSAVDPFSCRSETYVVEHDMAAVTLPILKRALRNCLDDTDTDTACDDVQIYINFELDLQKSFTFDADAIIRQSLTTQQNECVNMENLQLNEQQRVYFNVSYQQKLKVSIAAAQQSLVFRRHRFQREHMQHVIMSLFADPRTLSVDLLETVIHLRSRVETVCAHVSGADAAFQSAVASHHEQISYF